MTSSSSPIPGPIATEVCSGQAWATAEVLYAVKADEREKQARARVMVMVMVVIRFRVWVANPNPSPSPNPDSNPNPNQRAKEERRQAAFDLKQAS